MNERRQGFDMMGSMRRMLRVMALAFAVTMIGTVGLVLVSGLALAQSDSDTPAAECGSGPNVVCPDASDPSATYIGSVTALPDGVVILLTDAGLEKARECGGAAEIALMTEALYATIPDDQTSDFQLDWTSQNLADEIYGHAFLNRLSSGLGGLGDIHERSNPVNVVFADYGGPGQMTMEAIAEQKTFAALGAVHRASC